MTKLLQAKNLSELKANDISNFVHDFADKAYNLNLGTYEECEAIGMVECLKIVNSFGMATKGLVIKKKYN